MAQVERRKKTKKKKKKHRAEKIFTRNSNNKKSNKRRANLGAYFEDRLELDQEKRVIDQERLRKSDLIPTFEKPKAKFNRFLANQQTSNQTVDAKKDLKRRRTGDELKLEQEEPGKREVEEERRNGWNGQNKREKWERGSGEMIELEVDEEDRAELVEEPKEDFVRNTANVKITEAERVAEAGPNEVDQGNGKEEGACQGNLFQARKAAVSVHVQSGKKRRAPVEAAKHAQTTEESVHGTH